MQSNKNNKKSTVSPKNKEIKKYKVGSEPDAAFNWFPGHMMKAMREIKSKASSVDLIIEIRDARIPLVSGNMSLMTSLKGKCHLILLNKSNLADPEVILEWSKWFEKNQVPFLFINCLEKNAIKDVLRKGKEIIEKKRKECNPDGLSAKEKYKFMIVGLPNTGKSTFINQVAHRQATKVADKPGQTQVQLWVNVDDEMMLLDTPGVMPPQVEKDEHKIWLSLINAIPDYVVGEEDPACYLVNYYKKKKVPEFFNRYGLDLVDHTVEEILSHIASKRGCLKQKGLPDFERVFKLILQDFRAGHLGKISLEYPPSLTNR